MQHANQRSPWEKMYESKRETDFSWFQFYPKTSVDLIKDLHLDLHSKIIDIGGGDSHLVDALLDLGYTHIYVLDISEKTIERAKVKLGEKSRLVNWIISDVTEFKSAVQFDLWYDRAAFHFLTDKASADQYCAIAKKIIRDRGHLIIGTFSEKGPDKCSGLEIKKYSDITLEAVFKNGFEKIRCLEENHITPFHTNQSFTYCVFTRK